MSASNAPAVSIRTDGTDGIVFGEGAGVRTFVVVLLYYHSEWWVDFALQLARL